VKAPSHRVELNRKLLICRKAFRVPFTVFIFVQPTRRYFLSLASAKVYTSQTTMKFTAIAVCLGLVARTTLAQLGTPPSGCCATAAMLRFSCSRLVIERLDPLVNPGVIGTPHNHQIVGGNSFNASMEPVSYDPATESTCTSCTFSEDFSNYWTANLYFQARNGTFKRVPQMVNLGLEGNEGITIYYIPPYDGKTKVTAFKQVS
jgi:hypothetical protein